LFAGKNQKIQGPGEIMGFKEQDRAIRCHGTRSISIHIVYIENEGADV